MMSLVHQLCTANAFKRLNLNELREGVCGSCGVDHSRYFYGSEIVLKAYCEKNKRFYRGLVLLSFMILFDFTYVCEA